MRSAIERLNSHCYKRACVTLNQQNNITNSFLFNTNSQISFNDSTHGSRSRSYSTRLAEVGRFESKQPDENVYAPGQPFLHQIFGYRGVILFPWMARVHDIDIRKQFSDEGVIKGTGFESHQKPHRQLHSHLSYKPSRNSDNQDLNGTDDYNQTTGNKQDIDGSIPASRMNANSTRFHPYYQVLIDTRDCPYVSNRTQTEAVTFLGHPDNSKSVYSIKGLDYVAHEDILPYTSYEETPIHHELHGKLFRFNQDSDSKLKYMATELLESWKNKHPWLELSRVYRETTENVRVTVIPFYLGHTTIEDISFHWWRYCVRLENFNDVNVQLRERHWKIFSQTNMLQTIKGRGVVGVEPLLTKSEPAYQYSSHVNLQDRSGHMWGTFRMQREDGHTFECRIPPFSLESSIDTTTPPASKRA